MLLQTLKLFSELLLNTYGLATSMLAPVLGLGIAASASAPCTTNSTWILYCDCELMGDSDNDSRGRIDGDNTYTKRIELVLVSSSELYSKLESIYVSVSGPSSYSI